MPGYLSEIHYDGSKTVDFFEIAVPTGTDISAYSLAFYDSGGVNYNSKPLGTPVSNTFGHDVYVIDSSTSFFPDSRDGHGVALVDDTGTVLQFVSYGVSPSTINATDGPAAGQTSTYIGNAPNGSSLESTDGGASYATQSSPNSGTIPCYAPGTLIDTTDGPQTIETLRRGDQVLTLDHGPQEILWIGAFDQQLPGGDRDAKPVLIAPGALGPGRPARNLIVSPQHRILVGGEGQLEHVFACPRLAPAKALTGLPGIRAMMGRRAITWRHFACAHHEVVHANGCVTESLLLGPMVRQGFSRAQRRDVTRILGCKNDGSPTPHSRPARETMTVQAARKIIKVSKRQRIAPQIPTGTGPAMDQDKRRAALPLP